MARRKKTEEATEGQRPVTLQNPADIDLRLLRVFCVVVESGGFSTAQSELNIGQSTISTHMAELEAYLDMRLCRRGRGGFALTEQGETVYEAAQRLFAALENFGSDVNEIRGKLTGSLSLGILHTMVTDSGNRVTEAIATFKKKAPEVRINLTVTSPSEISRALTDGRLHLGFSTGHHREPGLDYEELYSERQLLYCAVGHPLFEAAPNNITMKDLRDLDYVTRGYEEREAFQEKIRARVTSIAYPLEGISTMILTGGFIGTMPIDYARIWTERDIMRPLLPDVLNAQTQLYVVSKRGARPVALVKAFRKELAAVLTAYRT
ncbi:LysR family transcriptional regulator [Sinorhizobium meliloti]|uniref:LysR family transcriptional regulator n=1 Tax=Rhizobium meliloti TaxID=382 RepID=UPI003D6547EB